ncbi:matrix metalloproteinase-25-like [Brienomyrus brachyistius]|uniref:matrix metalloproteinase-25-like n=1 Tax=Brienomyrus brachyistius TaxID=42636 RepID=UPI0020B264E7|nr:matrix metalloproteinase-25-like [Brienomyrus brachyistius]
MFPNMTTTAIIRHVTCISVAVICAGFAAPAVDQYTRGVDWLSRYGYLPPPDPHTGMLQTMDEIKNALKEMQSFAGLNATGILDADTLHLMSTPRCSLPDIMRAEDKLRKRRRKRYVLSGSRWHKTDITWSLNSYPSPSSKLNPQLVQQLLSQAFRVWSDVIPLNFHYKRDLKEEGDIRVYFASGFHQDGYPFDGKGGTLAHAFFPSNHEMAGDTHFDNDEIWSFGDDSASTDLFTVAVHEFGHALGLSHSSAELSIMRPYYEGAIKDINSYKLPKDDKLGIQALYGKRNDRVAPDPRIPPIPDRPHQPNPPPSKPTQHPDPSLPDRCKGGFDAVANIRGEVFFFKGPHFWRVRQSGSLLSFTPALIKNFWIGLPPETNKIDAVYERTSDSNIIFFIGNQYWVFKETISLPGYPHPLSEWRMETSEGRNVQRVEAAFVWARNGKTYLFSNGEFWGFDDERQIGRNMDGQYPRKTTLWKGVPFDPDGVISWGDDLYFFKGNSYWILKNGEMNHEAIISKSVAVDWMKCPKPQMRDECNCPLGAALMSQISFWVIWISTVNVCVFII